jgi:RecA/RadA recombinase
MAPSKKKGKEDEGPVEPLASFSAREFVEAFKKKHGEKYATLVTGLDYESADVPLYVSCGSTALDIAFGGLGLPGGRIVEVAGDRSAGKSLLGEAACITAQKRGGVAVILDAEGTFNKSRYGAAGGNLTDTIFIDKTDTLEDGFEGIERTVKMLLEIEGLKGKPIVVVWDTICTDKTRAEQQQGKYSMGMMYGPKVLKEKLKDLVRLISGTNVSFLMLNQQYAGNVKNEPSKVQQVYQGSGKIIGGGGGPEYYCTIICELVELASYQSLRTGKPGKLMSLTILKSKMSSTPRKAVFACDEIGVDDTMSIFFNLSRTARTPERDKQGLISHDHFSASASWTSVEHPKFGKISWQNEEGFYKHVQKHGEELVSWLAGLLWDLFPASPPTIDIADAAYVEKHKLHSPWVTEGKQYVRCPISNHRCEPGAWTMCQAVFFTACEKKLPDVQPLKRVYHDPLVIDAEIPDPPKPDSKTKAEDILRKLTDDA